MYEYRVFLKQTTDPVQVAMSSESGNLIRCYNAGSDSLRIQSTNTEWQVQREFTVNPGATGVYEFDHGVRFSSEGVISAFYDLVFKLLNTP